MYPEPLSATTIELILGALSSVIFWLLRSSNPAISDSRRKLLTRLFTMIVMALINRLIKWYHNHDEYHRHLTASKLGFDAFKSKFKKRNKIG